MSFRVAGVLDFCLRSIAVPAFQHCALLCVIRYVQSSFAILGLVACVRNAPSQGPATLLRPVSPGKSIHSLCLLVTFSTRVSEHNGVHLGDLYGIGQPGLDVVVLGHL